MRILQVITSMDPKSGGTSQGLRNSIPALAEVGLYSDVLSFDSPNAAFLTNDQLNIIPIGPAIGPYAFCRQLDSWLSAHLALYDQVVINGLWLYSSFGTFNAWRKYGKGQKKWPKLYVMPHGMLDPYFQKARERRLKALRNRVFWQFFEKKVINGADGILFTCQQELELARTTFPDYHPKAEINIGYGIQAPPAFDVSMQNAFWNRCPTVKGKKYFLFLSRIDPKKGVDILIAAYAALKQKYGSLPELVIAGPGLDTVYGKKMQAFAAGISGIHFPGMLLGDAKWGAYYGAELFLLPSHQENFGIAVVEALACGVPVIISDKVNIWKEIVAHNAGWSAEDKVNDFTAVWISAWRSLEMQDRNILKHNAQTISETVFSLRKWAENFKSLMH